MKMEATLTVHVLQGENQVSDRPDTMMTTVLGSCVSACLYDPVRRIGGMNHFLLPDGAGSPDLPHASAAMERLLNALIKQGARRDRIEAKLFGGARMLAGLPDVGRRNGDAALSFLRSEGIALRAQSLGGAQARRVRFWPTTGRAQQLLLDQAQPEIRPPDAAPDFGSIELF